MQRMVVELFKPEGLFHTPEIFGAESAVLQVLANLKTSAAGVSHGQFFFFFPVSGSRLSGIFLQFRSYPCQPGTKTSNHHHRGRHNLLKHPVETLLPSPGKEIHIDILDLCRRDFVFHRSGREEADEGG